MLGLLITLAMFTTTAVAADNSVQESHSETNSAVIDNGVVKLGVNDQGHLIVGGVGLTYMPTFGEALAPGCWCEGWGVGDNITEKSGWASWSNGGIVNVELVSFTSNATTATSVVNITDPVNQEAYLEVTHYYHPSVSPNLYQVDVSIKNIGASSVELLYRRTMDWDVPPTTFSEYVTIEKGTATDVVYTSDDGFANSNPLAGPSYILFEGEAVDSGPADHGSLFDFNFGTLVSGETKEFTIFYGAAGSEAEANTALATVGAEVYSLGQPSNTGGPDLGTPNTFIFAFAGVGGTPVFPQCSDGVDNDNDGKTDYPDDSGCTSPSDADENDGTVPVPEFPTLIVPVAGILGMMILLNRRREN